MNNIGDAILIDAIIAEEETYEYNLNRRGLRDASNPFEMPENIFKGIYRFSRDTARNLLDDLLPYMPIEGNIRQIPNSMKILVALQFFAQGCYQKAVGQSHFVAMSQSSVSRCIASATEAVMHLSHIVRFPDSEEKCNEEKLKFIQRYDNAYPGIIGAIDCTHVNILAPPVEDEINPGVVFLNRRGNHSLNVQFVVTADLKILNCNARFPGSVHDSAIWHTSIIRQVCQRMYNAGQRDFWLIGDSGYPLEPWLMTTFTGANLTEAQRRFNNAHKSTRNVVERFNGVLKGRFRCLGKHRTLHYQPETAANIINTCAILHNYLAIRGEIEEDEIEHDYDSDDEPNDNNNNNNNLNLNCLQEGRAIRNRIVRDYF